MEDSENIYKLAFQYARLTNCNLFITGKAGSGKTTLIRNFCQTSDKNIAITAPTGVAAINAGGVTLHSLFQLPLQPFVPTETGRREFIASLRVPASKRRLLYNLDTLIIDEISMVRADVLDAIDTELQHFRGNRLPFGGVQVILLGDLHQLSPVSTDNDMQLLAPHYPSMYFFSSRVIENHPPLYIQFDHIYRQSDPKFIDLLNAIRDNCLTQAHYRLLDTLYHPGKSLPDDCIVLTTHNQKADSINAERLKAIRSHERKFHAAVNGDFPEKNYATDETLVLKKGARVMFLRNNQEKGYYNGKTGIVTDFIGNHVEVRCDEDGKSILVEPEVWSNVSYTVNSTSGAIESHVQGTFTQIPLRLAWAITIHKSQGLTFNKVAIDAAQSFASGQVYVALSRCRSLEGLRLLSPISAKSLRHDQAVSNYDRQRQTVGQLQEAWEGHTHQFQLDLLTRLYDFSLPIGGLSRLIRQVADASNNWSEDTMPFLTSLKDGLVAQQAVALSFQQQLESHLRKQWDEHWVGQRLVAASQYFTAHLQQWIQAIRNSPVRTDSKPLAATRPSEPTANRWPQPTTMPYATCMPNSTPKSR